MYIDIKHTDKKYNIIYADPPWSFKTYSEKGMGKSAQKHYPCMTMSDIKLLPVSNLAHKDCILFLWATMPMLQEALEVIKSWGFIYKTCGFVWVKENKTKVGLSWGCGYWTRSNAELLLLATKGNPKRINRSVHQVILSPRRRHSQKPDETRIRIEQLCGDLPRIELFARETVSGWDCWGNDENIKE